MAGFSGRFSARSRAADVELFARVAATADANIASAPGAAAAVWDGVTLAAGDPVFLGAQAAAAESGLYTYPGAGLPMTRHRKMRDGDQLFDGIEVIIGQGADGKDARWRLVTDRPAGGYVLGTTSLSWVEIRALSASAGTEQVYTCPGAAVVGSPVYIDGHNSVDLARADDTGKPCALVVTEKITPTRCRATSAGRVSGLSGLTAGAVYWLDTEGGSTTTPPAAGSGDLAQRIGVAASATALDLMIDRVLVVA